MPKDFYTLADLRDWEHAAADEPAPARLAVVGDPVAHSKSPQMHNAALEACAIKARYVRLHIRPEELAEAMRLLPEKGFLGANFTIPHKAGVLRLADEADPHAQTMGAANTVLIEGDNRVAFSTDGPGMVRALREQFSLDLSDLRVLVLGAGGGAGRSIAIQCAIAGSERLLLVNRTFEKAQALAAELKPYFQSERLLGPAERLAALEWDSPRLRRELEETDLIVNATSLGMRRGDPPLLPSGALLPHHVVFDTVYGGGSKTPILSAAQAAGARGCDGLPMLLHQGALSFEIWFNRPAPIDAMRRGLLSDDN